MNACSAWKRIWRSWSATFIRVVSVVSSATVLRFSRLPPRSNV
jgi:hypothetical protein